ncbi:MAG: prolyl oligopeptidase family serine peptidase [Candidatus Aminicenantaceae bacterium]
MKKFLFLLCVTLICLSGLLSAQETYKLPPKEVLDIVTTPPPPRVFMSHSDEVMVLGEYEAMPSLAYMAQPLLRLAGTRILPQYNSRQTTTFYTKLTIKTIKDEKEIPVTLPDGARVGSLSWSYDSRSFAFTRLTDTGFELWMADAATGKTQRLTGPILNPTINSGFAWQPGSGSLLVYGIVEGRGAPPQAPEVPSGPNIQETSGRVASVRTYQDLLKDPFDGKLFKYYATSQIWRVDAASGEAQKIGKPGMYLYADPSPDGRYLMVHRLKEPFSYSVSYYSFPYSLEIWDSDGRLVHLFADMPLADEVPIRGVPKGPRSVEWRPLKPATLVWVEALDEGDPKKDVPFRDRLMTLSPPFTGDPAEILKIKHRYGGISWLQTPGLGFLTESEWMRRWRTTYLVDVDKPGGDPRKVFDLSSQDRYNDPGRPVTVSTAAGEYLIPVENGKIYLSGNGASPQGDRPFLDSYDLESGETERLFHCGEDSYESFVGFAGESRQMILTSFESKTEPPNYYLYDLRQKARKALTDYQDPAPQMTGMKKQLVKYNREDGVPLSGTLYLPPDYQPGQRLPLVMWAYPIEYSDARVAGQVRGSENRFTFFRGTSQLFFVTQGYAVLDAAQMPVIGDPETMNDTFVEQIVAAAKAGIDKLDEMGIIDPKRVGVGGHSYGAFMTANLLAHCDLFASGVARSGAYNRTLTPFGFQSERRTLWQAPEIYFKVSPFMHAHKINEPILLIHGEMDNNSGTFPIQSRRLFHALKGHGATARLVFLPYESHGYRAKESVLHVLAEMIEWFDAYVKNRK